MLLNSTSVVNTYSNHNYNGQSRDIALHSISIKLLQMTAHVISPMTLLAKRNLVIKYSRSVNLWCRTVEKV